MKKIRKFCHTGHATDWLILALAVVSGLAVRLGHKKGAMKFLGCLALFVFAAGAFSTDVYASATKGLTNPKTITVNVTAGSEYLDTYGAYLKVDGQEVVNGSVTVEQAATHEISVLPQFGYSIEAKINGAEISGTESNGWMSYTVQEADTYQIEISTAGSNVYTVTWAYDDSFGVDGKVSNGTVKIIKATLPDGSDGIGNVNQQDHTGGLVAIAPDSIVTVEMKPAYGYQFVEGSLNGNTITAGTEVSTFTFTMPSTNLHLSVLFTKTEDIINADSTQVLSGSIANGENVVDTGNLKLEIGDLSQEQIDAADAGIKQTAGNDEIQLYLDMSLYSVVNKGNRTDVWENKLSNLNGELSVTLELSDELKGKDGTFYVIREHTEADGTKSYTKIQAAYDKETGTITFVTNKFSTYALVLEKEEGMQNATNSANNAYHADLSESLDDLLRKTLTDADRKRLESGEAAKVYLEVSDISSTVSDAEKQIIESARGKSVVGMYLGIDLRKQIGADLPVNVTETNGSVTITLKIPAALINYNTSITRTYQIIRIHNGQATVIPCAFAKEGSISFETDRFSTYALAYTDQHQINYGSGSAGGSVSLGSVNGGSGIGQKSPKTGERSSLVLWIPVISVSAVGAFLLTDGKDRFVKGKKR
ncbi:MAG: hypothetical protein ACI4DR_03045 [Roseburia sp.]